MENMEYLSAHLFLYRDTCLVYVIRSGEEAALVDFGDGAVLDHLEDLGIGRITDILMTHHHRDQAQGLAQALARRDSRLAGVRIWAPHAEQNLFSSVEEHWQARPLLNNYDVRQDRYSILETVALTGTLKDYAPIKLGDWEAQVIPTPGHTPGSISLLAEIDGRKVAFTGDCIAGPGKVWSMAALQWSYQTMEGAAALILSLKDLKNRGPVAIFPSHGEIIEDPAAAIDLLVSRLWILLDARGENRRLLTWLEKPYEEITPHLLRNRTSISNSYVLLSNSGKALLIDYGYDFVPGHLVGPDRALHRPWLYTLPLLKRDYSVHSIDAVIATHYHDDHVAGLNLLRDVEGTQVWAGESFADILEHPDYYDLPCLWYDPIRVDRRLKEGEVIHWEEYTISIYPLSGHTRFATAVAFEVDGKRVLATGDQLKGNEGLGWNYVYQNRFDFKDYIMSADFYTRIAPDLILPGHWDPLWIDAAYLEQLCESSETLAELHTDLLPLESIDLGGEGFAARIYPYHWSGKMGDEILFQVEVRNPFHVETEMRAVLVLPERWRSPEPEKCVRVGADQVIHVQMVVIPPVGVTGRRFRLAVDITAGALRLGQQAEALIDLLD